jgi:hypothetical protein
LKKSRFKAKTKLTQINEDLVQEDEVDDDDDDDDDLPLIGDLPLVKSKMMKRNSEEPKPINKLELIQEKSEDSKSKQSDDFDLAAK